MIGGGGGEGGGKERGSGEWSLAFLGGEERGRSS